MNGEIHDLTPGSEVKAGFLGWGEDGSSFYVTSTERNGRNFDLYRHATSDYRRDLVFENPGGLWIFDISPDERWLMLIEFRNNADSNIYVVDLESAAKEPMLITEHEGFVQHSGYGFTPNSRYVDYGSDEHGEFTQVWQYDLYTGQRSLLIESEWDVLDVAYSPKGRYRVSSVNADARTVATIVDIASGKEMELPDLPHGNLLRVRFSANENKLVLIVDAADSPSDIFLVDLDFGRSRQLTEALNPAINPSHLVRGEVIRYKSFDGLDIPGILFKPHGASPENPVPALVYVHGGPGLQSRTGYRATFQYLINNGYAIFAANNRGSTGYGKTFFHLDDRRHGEEDLQDIVYARHYLENLDWISDNAIGVIGESYGGFMTVAALAFEPDAFDVGIDIFGVTNWVRTLKSIPPWWEDFKNGIYNEMGDPATHEELHRRISPLFHANNIRKPLLVIQGANDPRVLQVESDELVEAVRANNVPVTYVVFPNEGHNFKKRANRIVASEAYIEFLNTYLRGNVLTIPNDGSR